MSTSAVRQQHATWLGLIDTQGPFLTLPVLTRVLHDGLEPTSKRDWNALRPAYQTWAADRDSTSKSVQAHADWVHHVVTGLLDWDTDADLTGPFETWSHTEPEHNVTVTPTFTLNDTTGTPVVLGFVYPYDTPMTGRVKDDGWAANRLDRAAATLRATGVEFGIVTDGRWWSLVWAPRGGASAHAIWDAVLWLEDRTTLDAFTTLLSRRRFLAVADDATLKGMLVASLDSQEEVTDQLGKQVRAAAEFLVEAFGRADHNEGGHRLVAVDNDDIYNGAVTVLMRLVFMFCAEERRLLPADSDFYLRAYSVSALADRLAQEAADRGESTLEHSTAAWHQLLATFRIVYAGSSHQSFAMPGYGGSIFEPTKYPWLEGDDQRGPIPVDDRTVHHILRGLTRLTFREKGVTESRKISYRALDVEQIGYVYEGLLDHTATRASDTTLGFTGKNEPEITLSELEAESSRGEAAFAAWLAKETGLSGNAVKKGLVGPTDRNAVDAQRRRVYAACDNNNDLTMRVLKYAGLLRQDPRGLPVVYLPERLFVTSSSTRSNTGTHYTPKVLAERVVATTLEALVYKPGPLDTDDREQWHLISAADILELRVADIAMGSGAFLVAACRYLAERLLEAVLNEADPDLLVGELVDVWVMATDRVATIATADAEVDEAVLYARRLVTERCLYGTDINPMAVEMAKLSLWLITAARDKPFGFLDHRFVAGDSLLGLPRVGQIEYIHVNPAKGRALHAEALTDHTAHVQRALQEAAALRSRLAATPALDLRAVEIKSELLQEANDRLEGLTLLADAISGAALASATSAGTLDTNLLRIADRVPDLLGDSVSDTQRQTASVLLSEMAQRWLETDRPADAFPRHPLQWVTRFPEVFLDSEAAGFDAVIGNPPFLGGGKISGAAGSAYRQYLGQVVASGKKVKRPDLVAFMMLQVVSVLRRDGVAGLLATDAVVQGDTRVMGLDQIAASGASIFAATTAKKWPSRGANVNFVTVFLSNLDRKITAARRLDGKLVDAITSTLHAGSRVTGNPERLEANRDLVWQGSVLHGSGFILSTEEGEAMLASDPANEKVVLPYLSGDDLNDSATPQAQRMVVFFRNWSASTASRYREPWAWVKDRVRTEREHLDPAYYGRIIDNWWQFWAPRMDLYSKLERSKYAIVWPRASWSITPGVTSTDQVFQDNVAVLPADDLSWVALLSSEMHLLWAERWRKQAGKPTYGLTHLFETLPLPTNLHELHALGEQLAQERQALMSAQGVGLLRVEARANDPAARDEAIDRYRTLLEHCNRGVLRAYGWLDLTEIPMGHHPVARGVRWTYPKETQVEIADRLLERNQQQARSEKQVVRLRPSTVSKPPKAATDGQDALFQVTDEG